MKRTIAIKLTLSESEVQAFTALQNQFTLACNRVSDIALAENERNRVRLHHLCYYILRKELSELGSQMCCNAIAKVSQALNVFKRPKPIFFKRGCSVHFDKKNLLVERGGSFSFYFGKESPYPA